MFDQLFERAATITRHATAPFAEERIRYLEYCGQRGDSRGMKLCKAYDLLWIARKLSRYTDLYVTIDQVRALVVNGSDREDTGGPKLHLLSTRKRLIGHACAWLRYLGYQNKKVLYDMLFHTSAETLRTIAADPKHLGAEVGFFTILHTWGQQLLHHPHVHCVVPGGGISPDGERWVACRPGFFLPVRVLSRLFRRLFLEQLNKAFDAGELHFYSQLEPLKDTQAFATYLAPTRQDEWVVYAKPPFGGAAHVLDYLGRYTHRVAISNNRLLSMDHGKVTFLWKNYKHPGAKRHMTLEANEFIRRFLLHILPTGFKHIRSYGFLANRCRETKIATCRRLLSEPIPTIEESGEPEDYRDLYERLTGKSLRACPICGKGHMLCIETFPVGSLPRAPPQLSS